MLDELWDGYGNLEPEQKRTVATVVSNYPIEDVVDKTVHDVLDMWNRSNHNYNSTVYKLDKLFEKYENHPRFTPNVRKYLVVAHKLESALKNHVDFATDPDLVQFVNGPERRSEHSSVQDVEDLIRSLDD